MVSWLASIVLLIVYLVKIHQLKDTVAANLNL